MLERSKGRRQTKRDPHHCLVAKRDLQRLRETTPTENSRLEGFRWQPHYQARVLWANNLHTLNPDIKETSTSRNQLDSRTTTFGMKRKTKIGIWNVRTLRETGKLRQAVACMRNYGLNILGMSEVRWRGYILEGPRMIVLAEKAWVY